jgi:PAS domain S-box-containing protein
VLIIPAETVENGAKIAFRSIMSARGGPEIAVILLDENGCIVDAHASCTETFGWRREELVGKDIRELLQYGRDLLMSQLHLLEENDSAGNTSFSIRVLAKRKDQHQFPARATVRRFKELECWTVAFYQAESESVESTFSPSVSPQEIALAKRALEETSPAIIRERKRKSEAKKGEGMSVSRLWRNSRLLFGSRNQQPEPDLEPEPVLIAESPSEEEIVEQAGVLAAQCTAEPVAVTAPAAAPTALFETPAPEVEEPKPEFTAPVQGEVEPAPTARVVTPIETAMPIIEPRVVTSPRFDTQPSESALLARLKAELEKERGERARIEQRAASLSSQVQSLHLQLSEGLNLERDNQSRIASLEQELRTTQETYAQTKADLDNQRREQQSTEDQLCVVRELNEQLQANLGVFENTRKSFETAQTAFRGQLDKSNSALREAEAALDTERDARQRLEHTLSTTLRDHRAAEQKLTVELAEFRTALETARLEKSRGQEEVLRGRAECLATINETASRANRLRSNFSQVLAHIDGTTRELLQSPLSEEQKYVIETLLQDVIALEASLEEESAAPQQVAA